MAYTPTPTDGTPSKLGDSGLKARVEKTLVRTETREVYRHLCLFS